jgi:hypothetical protein
VKARPTAAWPRQRKVTWDACYRLVPSRYPPIDLFERVADPRDWEILAAIEGLTNDRLRDQIGTISAVPAEERISGPGASPIMAAFTHIGFPSRFTDGRYGVYYASDRLAGALAEVAYHQRRFLERTAEPPTWLQMRAYIAAVAAPFHDVRGGFPEVHHPDSYVASQKLGAAVRAAEGNGIVYDSVRLQGAANLAVFRPRAIASTGRRAHVMQGPHLVLDWDGKAIPRYIEMGQSRWQPFPAA